MGCPIDYARALKDVTVPCGIAPGWAVGTILGAVTKG